MCNVYILHLIYSYQIELLLTSLLSGISTNHFNCFCFFFFFFVCLFVFYSQISSFFVFFFFLQESLVCIRLSVLNDIKKEKKKKKAVLFCKGISKIIWCACELTNNTTHIKSVPFLFLFFFFFFLMTHLNLQ